MKTLLEKFENKRPEIVFEWQDAETEAEGWIVINSLRNGAAGGGTRMREGLNRAEVESLAKTMEIKFTVSGPAIGGAKSGINFNPADPRKQGVLERWYKAVTPLLKAYYGTGGDLNIDEIHEVIPITEDYGLWHPQEGIVNGHFKATDPQKIRKIGQLRLGVSKVLEDPHFSPSTAKKYTVADMITGYGVAEAVKHYYSLWGGELKEKKAIIQGWGNVGAATAFYLARRGVKITGIIDKAGGVLNPEGFGFEEIKELLLNREKNSLKAAGLIPFSEINQEIWKANAHIFVPAAASRLVTKEQITLLASGGLEVVSSGANVPFQDNKIFFGPVMEYTDNQVSLIPDFIANCGMARVFAYLMSSKAEVTDEAIFNDTSRVIGKAMENIYAVNSNKTGIAETAYELALKELID